MRRAAWIASAEFHSAAVERALFFSRVLLQRTHVQRLNRFSVDRVAIRLVVCNVDLDHDPTHRISTCSDPVRRSSALTGAHALLRGRALRPARGSQQTIFRRGADRRAEANQGQVGRLVQGKLRANHPFSAPLNRDCRFSSRVAVLKRAPVPQSGLLKICSQAFAPCRFLVQGRAPSPPTNPPAQANGTTTAPWHCGAFRPHHCGRATAVSAIAPQPAGAAMLGTSFAQIWALSWQLGFRIALRYRAAMAGPRAAA